MQTKLIAAGVLVVGASALGGVYFWGGEKDSVVEQDLSARYAQSSSSESASSFEPAEYESVERKEPEQSGRSVDRGGFNRGDFAARMAQFDLDGDGFLSDEERDEMRKAMREEMMARFDLDGDGEISREERMAARQGRFENSERGQALMRQFDADGDGVLSAEEQAAMDAYNQEQRDARRADEIVRYDTDGDGELSREERQVQRDEQQAQREDFRQNMNDEFDLDGDGQLNIDEQQDAFNTMRERREIDQFVNQFDSDGDGRMGSGDYDSFISDYSNGNMGADVNRDGVVDTQDIAAYRDMVTRSNNRP
jgi:Ca2+-binding EF-hand superfamily protein